MNIEKVEKFVANLRDKTEYVIQARSLKQALNHGLALKSYIESLYWYKYWAKEKSKKTILRKTFSSLWKIQFLEKLWKMFENIDTLILYQQRKEENI